MTAKFEIHEVLVMADGSTVITGWVLKGKCDAGSWLSVPDLPGKLIIQGIEQLPADAQTGLRHGLIGLQFGVLDGWEDWLKELVAKGPVVKVDRELHIPERYALAAIVVISILNAAAVLRFGWNGTLIGLGLGLLESYILNFGMPRRLLTGPLLAMVLNMGLGSLTLLGYCAILPNALCGRNPVAATLMPSMWIGIGLVMQLFGRAYGAIRPFFVGEG